MEIKVDEGRMKTASLKHVYVVYGYNCYTGGAHVYGVFESRAGAEACVQADIASSTHPNEDNGGVPPWAEDDIWHVENEDQWHAGDEYIWEIVKKEIEK